ncbi:MAG: hypothetical protein IH597_14625 [Bacteroidales bacterium]|nr:hypothetical protein [Bacteroidales bacterium]
MNTSKHFFFLILLVWILAPSALNAQGSDNDEEPKRWFVGGNVGLQFGYVTLIDVSPMVGYMLTDRFALGTGLTYKYYRIREFFLILTKTNGRDFRATFMEDQYLQGITLRGSFLPTQNMNICASGMKCMCKTHPVKNTTGNISM